MTIGSLMKALERTLEIGPHACMVQDEEAKGFKCVFPGQVEWLCADDWPQDIVISLHGRNVRIVAIYNVDQGNGAFSRLITAIAKAGLRPTVVCPSRQMHEICKAWGWHEQHVGSSFEDHEHWLFPTRKWLEQRANV